MVFKNILVPVDFSLNTEIAVKKAIEMLDVDSPVIHLLHVIEPISDLRKLIKLIYQGFNSDNADLFRIEKNKLQQLSVQISKKLPANGRVEISIIKGTVEQCIVQQAKALNCELIILGKHNSQRLFPFFNQVSPNKIARSSNCAVLMAKSGSMGEKLKSVVVPIGKLVPRRKIELLVALSNKFHAKIHLVTLKRSEGIMANDCSQTLLQTYRILKGMEPALPIVHKVIEGKNLANVSLKYAQSIHADMILVNPDTETRVSTFTWQHITDMLITNSRLQVMEVEP